MKREVFSLLIVSAATAYLFYYVLASRGGYFAMLSVSTLCIYFIKAWGDLFYRLGRNS
jgi:predicted secreted protein